MDNPDNYRGISITNSIAKLYDMVICERHYQWLSRAGCELGHNRSRGVWNILPLYVLSLNWQRRKNNICSVY